MPNQEKLLIIVESPSKTKTIAKYIDNASVIASVGHFKDLPKKEMGIDIENDFAMKIQTMPDRKKFITQLKAEVKLADRILIATDPDREGEAIAADIASEIKQNIERVEFTEITKTAVQSAIKNSRDINYDLVDAQRARRAIDRIVGFTFSPVLWKTLRSIKNTGLSAGRVQSVALRLLVDREKDRNKFIKNTFYSIEVDLKEESHIETFKAKLVSYDGQTIAKGDDFGKFSSGLKNDKLLLIDGEKAKEIKTDTESNNWEISSIESKPTSSSPAPPFTTSTLQQDASRRFGYSPKKTMMVAQKLYEQGFITYMRTDSTNLSKEALAASKKFILDKFGKDFLPDSSNVYKSKVANAQEAHEAIRPAGTTFQEPAKILSSVGSDEGKLYGLILNRTLASQMKPAQYIRTNIALKNGKSMYKASGNITTFKGYTAVYEQALSRNQKAIVTALPPIENNSKILHTNIDTLEKNTTPPRRFSEAMLVKEMEARGIGRPSTYSAILDKLVKKEYVVKQNKALIPTFVGIAVTQLLENHYLSLFNEKFTAGMEQQLDAISRSESTYLSVLQEFYNGKEDYAGVAKLLEEEIDIAKACTVNISEKTNIRIGKFGPYVEKDGTNVTIPQDLFLGDLNQEQIDKLSSMQKEDNIIGTFNGGENILLKVGRYGPYVELQESKKRASIPKGTANEDITEKMASDLLSLPKTLGNHPDTGEDILATFGPYGPYVKCGKINASMKSTDSPLTISLEDAIKLIKDRKLKFEPTILGSDPKTKKDIAIKRGRFGPYVTDGKKNVSLKGYTIEDVTLEEAIKLLAEKK
ncbi:MAG: type I DNA topoisomerase [Candidatus Marinimicrobia bacterium]|jgi:DNA topoisomerase-1|nr:type I DNA topoisomerase [Candidatus Neomarinimicrobiota bacterium]MBT3943890.1 type I DNA topoisomerase [Candidatus Neomarinimicrobiota bacterium]MBT4111914.1 type I DNA topoisomerase [Candidatus Neomarinimicrobiota bacterium]MBT4316827.1 type I DNA topoisomerase [Candidatus Neomarinimicrobiota bacterium]MBT4706382.1 type I DNA topoisomerase [Candidatus Neomarinimicrobiota bacterium]